jgi:hypothetical protein
MTNSHAVTHDSCDYAYKQVKCDRCGREYTSTPSDDFYCAAEGDHCCERCLTTNGHPADFDLASLLSQWSDASRRKDGLGWRRA